MMNLLVANPLPNGHPITDKAVALAQTDPHGLTLTIISVSTVFIGLIILYFIYSLSGTSSPENTRRIPLRKRSSRRSLLPSQQMQAQKLQLPSLSH